MFKGFQDIMQKSSDKKEGSDKILLPVKNAVDILSGEIYQEALTSFPKLLNLSDENYQNLAQRLIDNFAEFIQELPETRGGIFSLRGGILEHVLNRSSMAVKQLRAIFLPSGDESSTLTQPQTLWAYTMFTAAILQGIGKVFVDLRVDLYDKNKRKLKEWTPFDGTMLSQAAFYDYDFDSTFGEDFRNRSTLLLARQLMPVEGFRWIASDKDLFEIWLAILDDDVRGARTLGPILWEADAWALQKYLENHNLIRDPKAFKDYGKFGKVGTTFSQPQDVKDLIKEKSGPEAGLAFLEWLKQQLGLEKIKVGDQVVISVPGGMMVLPEAFQLFVRENPNFKSWQGVQSAFASLGINRVGADGNTKQQYINLANGKTVEGIVVANQNILLDKKAAAKATGEGYVAVQNHVNQSQQYIATNGKLTSQTPTFDVVTNPLARK